MWLLLMFVWFDGIVCCSCVCVVWGVLCMCLCLLACVCFWFCACVWFFLSVCVLIGDACVLCGLMLFDFV